MASYPVRSVKVSARIPVPPDLLFAFVSDTRNDPLWCDNVETVDLLEGDGVEVGARFRFHQHLDRPRSDRIEFDADVVIVDVGPRTITWHVTDKFQDRNIHLIVEPDGAGSKITQITEASFQRPPGLAKLAYPLLARRTFKGQFVQLAAYFEGPGAK
ncbi:MAG TPA: SRPBCC family protein [Acidimicrobiia bacterium]